MALGFPGLQDLNRRTVRAPVNPVDKSTVVSIFPFRLDETKPTIQPGRFIMEPGSYEKPSVLVVGPSSWWREIDQEQPLLEITNSSVQIADSIVKDYCNGIPECDMDSCMPGFFYLPAVWTAKEVKEKHTPLLDAAKAKQDNWFRALVNRADVDWARSNGNPRSLTDIARYAARELGLQKEWIKDFQAVSLVRCKGCGNLRDPRFPICASCRMIDQDHPAAKEMKFAV